MVSNLTNQKGCKKFHIDTPPIWEGGRDDLRSFSREDVRREKKVKTKKGSKKTINVKQNNIFSWFLGRFLKQEMGLGISKLIFHYIEYCDILFML